MDMDLAKQTFIQEALELLASMESALLAFEDQADPGESINAIFRAVHTIKGSAGLFGLEGIVRFAHTLETVLDRVRNHEVSLNRASISHLLECHDHLAGMVNDLASQPEGSPDLDPHGRQLLEGLVPLLEGKEVAAFEVVRVDAPVAETAGAPALGGGNGADCWHLSIRFGRQVMQDGMDPLACLRYLGTLGTISHLFSLIHLPEGDAFNPEECYLGLEIELDTAADRKTLEEVFEFVREESVIRLIPPHAKIREYVALIQEAGDSGDLLGDILVKCGCISRDDLREALQIQGKELTTPGSMQRRLGEILMDEQSVPPAVVAAALDKQRRPADRQGIESKVVKVQADKLDRLVDLVGEIVIAGASAHVLAAATKEPALIESTAIINKLVEEIRDNALSLRMVQIGETFNRFRRVVRDVSRETGKAIELEIRGGDTELDKSIVEKLSDPLMHIVRNAIDHGIEPVEVRRARGKVDTGSLTLAATHEAGSIVIEVSDDGGGLNRERILAKAKEKGLIREGEVLSDQEVWQLIFEPGFSTAAAVTDISGRGVGMDVVRRNIDDLRGSIEIESYESAGTTFRIRLPLTLAIIDGFRVGVGAGSYVLPLELVQECVDLGPFLESAENHLVNLRGEVLPFIRLREIFGVHGALPPREQVVVVRYGETRAGIVVDRLLGEFQTVIKPLGELFRQIRGIGGSTILGSGEVALILDVPQLIQLVATANRRPTLSSTVN
ncbi:chemotaxis protein CheA [Geothrix limicola]|uniref:Chemotaxis protein CheA n=1 Tax=Geothrix limicola TaxID=2927978 RepID=A0ABQ5QA74_9BACT|nr:chemotaxis protein CheA [Geothrix limicola]GLH71725.1 chemotaxis protein CheA [Geothrix limicola]